VADRRNGVLNLHPSLSLSKYRVKMVKKKGKGSEKGKIQLEVD
jgi:hypothetical protein